jgi:hypothetical protein
MHHTSDDLEEVSKGMDSISLPVGTDVFFWGETIANDFGEDEGGMFNGVVALVLCVNVSRVI